MSKRRTSKNKNPFERKHQRHITSFTKSTISSDAKTSKPVTKKPTNSSVSNNISSKVNTSGTKKTPITSDKKPLPAEKNNIQEKVDNKKPSQGTRESKSENLEDMNLSNRETDNSQNTKLLVQNGSNSVSDHLDQSIKNEIDSSDHHASDRVNGTHSPNNNVLDNFDQSAAAMIRNNEADEGSKNKKEPTSFRQKINYVLKKVLFKKHVERK